MGWSAWRIALLAAPALGYLPYDVPGGPRAASFDTSNKFGRELDANEIEGFGGVHLGTPTEGSQLKEMGNLGGDRRFGRKRKIKSALPRTVPRMTLESSLPGSIDPMLAVDQAVMKLSRKESSLKDSLHRALGMCDAMGTDAKECFQKKEILLMKAQLKSVHAALMNVKGMMSRAQKVKSELVLAGHRLQTIKAKEDMTANLLKTEEYVDKEAWRQMELANRSDYKKAREEGLIKQWMEKFKVKLRKQEIHHEDDTSAIYEFRVKLNGLVAGIAIGDKFAAASYEQAEKALLKAYAREAAAGNMSYRAVNLINTTNVWLLKHKEQKWQRRRQELRRKAEAAADARILRHQLGNGTGMSGFGDGMANQNFSRASLRRAKRPLKLVARRGASSTKSAPASSESDSFGLGSESSDPYLQSEAQGLTKVDNADLAMEALREAEGPLGTQDVDIDSAGLDGAALKKMLRETEARHVENAAAENRNGYEANDGFGEAELDDFTDGTLHASAPAKTHAGIASAPSHPDEPEAIGNAEDDDEAFDNSSRERAEPSAGNPLIDGVGDSNPTVPASFGPDAANVAAPADPMDMDLSPDFAGEEGEDLTIERTPRHPSTLEDARASRRLRAPQQRQTPEGQRAIRADTGMEGMGFKAISRVLDRFTKEEDDAREEAKKIAQDEAEVTAAESEGPVYRGAEVPSEIVQHPTDEAARQSTKNLNTASERSWTEIGHGEESPQGTVEIFADR